MAENTNNSQQQQIPPQLIMKLKAQMQKKTQTNKTKDEKKKGLPLLITAQKSGK